MAGHDHRGGAVRTADAYAARQTGLAYASGQASVAGDDPGRSALPDGRRTSGGREALSRWHPDRTFPEHLARRPGTHLPARVSESAASTMEKFGAAYFLLVGIRRRGKRRDGIHSRGYCPTIPFCVRLYPQRIQRLERPADYTADAAVRH